MIIQAPAIGAPAIDAEPEVKLPTIEARASKLVPYSLVVENEKVLRFHRTALFNGGIVWAEGGYWGREIVKIRGIEVASLTAEKWHALLFDGEDPVPVEIRTGSNRTEIIEVLSKERHTL